MLERLAPARRSELLAALGAARALLDPRPGEGFAIRTFRIGDLGLLAGRQSRLYDEAYGWGGGIEVIEAEVTTAFLRDFKPGREQGWIAEVDGAMAGSVLLTDEGDGTARLRLLYVEPFARGRGIGEALVRACIDFAADTGYAAVTLWTHTILESARRIYAAHGFRIVETAVHTRFGPPIQGETWRLDLRS
jgi:GNAT superfamily N-acetyltransferase